jgi:hypothetical protein
VNIVVLDKQAVSALTPDFSLSDDIFVIRKQIEENYNYNHWSVTLWAPAYTTLSAIGTFDEYL